MSHFVFCFDFGLKYIGLAVGENITNIARPLNVLLAKDGIPDWLILDDLVFSWKPNKLIIGICFFRNENLQIINFCAKSFKKKLYNRYKIPIYEVNENYTTKDIKNMYKKYNIKNDFLKINALSAVLILEDWLKMN